MDLIEFYEAVNDIDKSYRKSMIQDLMDHKKPIIIYGAGEIAKRVIVLLNSYSIVPDYQMVDAGFETSTTYDIAAISYEDARRKWTDGQAIIIAGMRDYPHVRETAEMLGFQAYYFDNLFQTEEIEEAFFRENIQDFYTTYMLLEDEKSRMTMLQYIKTNLSHDPSYMFDVYDRGKQYFSFEQIKLSHKEVFVNCGSFVGDTILEFLKCVDGEFEKIYAFEADKNTFKILKENIQNENIVLINKGCYSHNSGISFFSANDSNGKMSKGMSMIIQEKNDKADRIETCKIDDVVNEKVSLINMDIEGAELEALKGAKLLLSNSKPRLAISVYHKKEDLIKIPRIIKEIDNDYKFALRAYCPWSEELVLYAYQ